MSSIAELIEAARADKQAADSVRQKQIEMRNLQSYETTRARLINGLKTVLGVDVDESEIKRTELGSDAIVTIDGLTFRVSESEPYFNDRVYVQIKCPNGHYPPDYLYYGKKTIEKPEHLLDAVELLERVAKHCKDCVFEGKRKTAFQILIDEIQVAGRHELIAAFAALAHKASERDLIEAAQVLRHFHG